MKYLVIIFITHDNNNPFVNFPRTPLANVWKPLAHFQLYFVIFLLWNVVDIDQWHPVRGRFIHRMLTLTCSTFSIIKIDGYYYCDQEVNIS
jgi:hypothetical protein